MVENTPALGTRTESVNPDLCATEGITDVQMQTPESTWADLVCPVITNAFLP